MRINYNLCKMIVKTAKHYTNVRRYWWYPGGVMGRGVYGMVEKQAPQIRDSYHCINSLGRKFEINSKLEFIQTFGFKTPF